MPDYANPQDLNRYGYVRGNPLRFADPSGHAVECSGGIDGCNSHQYSAPGGSYASPAQVEKAVETAGKIGQGFIVVSTVAVAWEYFGAEAIKDAAVWAGKRMATKQFLLRAGVSGTAGVAGDMIGQEASVGSYDWRRAPGVFVPNALGGGWLGEGYDVLKGGSLTMRTARIGTAGATNVLVSGAQRYFTGGQNSLNVAESDFLIGIGSGGLGEVVPLALKARTNLGGSYVEAISSFFTHTSFVSLASDATQWIRKQFNF